MALVDEYFRFIFNLAVIVLIFKAENISCEKDKGKNLSKFDNGKASMKRKMVED